MLFSVNLYIISNYMKVITVKLKERSYPVFVGQKIANLGSFLAKKNHARKVLVVTNPKIKTLYFSKLNASLTKAGFKVSAAVLPDGEKYKTLDSVKKLYSAALKAGLDRKSPVIALGGGIVGDIAGFFASTYLRGMPFVQVPTTLLAMVDSSLGGKTGVDLKEGKNLVGSFYQPKLVWIDISTLKSLPAAELQNGMAEVIKYGVIKDESFFKYLINNIKDIYKIKDQRYEAIVSRCCSIKAEVVARDEREEKGKREILNFGHTFGHAIETLSGYKLYSHGQAVAIGMNMAGSLAVSLGIFSEIDRVWIENLLYLAKLPTEIQGEISFKDLLPILLRDKKVRNGNLRFVLPVKIGKVKIFNVPIKDIKDYISEV